MEQIPAPSIEEAARLAYWGVTYQIYPRSFCDSNGDGIGDLPGVISKLDYLQELGVGTIWLSPVYDSPQADNGYDVRDYRNVWEGFGTTEDLKQLIDEAHSRDLKVLLDIMPNHLSTKSKEFEDACASKDSEYSDWFFFRDPASGDGPPETHPPNNFPSMFTDMTRDETGTVVKRSTHSAWRWVEAREQFVLCTFLPEQADLDWQHAPVRSFVLDTMSHLLDLGVDGFRVDAFGFMGKQPGLPDERPKPGVDPALFELVTGRLAADAPERAAAEAVRATVVNELSLFDTDARMGNPQLYEWICDMTDLIESHERVDGRPRRLVMESYELDPVEVAGHLDLRYAAPFDFFATKLPWSATAYNEYFDSLLATETGGRLLRFLQAASDNHDTSRSGSRFGPDSRKIARAMIVLLAMLPGNPTFYQGQELGLTNSVLSSELATDPDDRDMVRTPLPWTEDTPDGWLPIPPEHRARNVQAQELDPSSSLQLARSAFALRKASAALHAGVIIKSDPSFGIHFNPDSCTVFIRHGGGERYLVVVNKSNDPEKVELPGIHGAMGRIALSSLYGSSIDTEVDLLNIQVQPLEALVVKL